MLDFDPSPPSTLMRQVGSRWRSMSRSAGGAALLEAWGYAGEEAQEVEETILRMASTYLDSDTDM